MKKNDRFLEQLQRRRAMAASSSGVPQPEVPDTASMTDEELDAASTAARRRLLDLQHEEVRERELARAAGQGTAVPSSASSSTPSLAAVLGELKRARRRRWR